MFRKTLVCLVSCAALITSAHAADPGAWTGLYIGVNGGYSFDAQGAHDGVQDDGGFGGGQIGYNWQVPSGGRSRLVLGAEADFQGTGIDHSGSGLLRGVTTGAIYSDWHTRSIDDFGTVRGRLGMASGRTFAYFTGGFAYGSVKNTFENLDTNNIYKADGTRTGYVFGGGVEYKVTPKWSLKLEFQYIDLSADRPAGNLGGYIITKDTELETVRGGINYHF